MKISNKKTWFFAFCTIAAVAMALPPVLNLLRYAHPSWYYTHIPLIPVISAYIFFRRRRDVFPETKKLSRSGLLIMAAGTGLFLIGRPEPSALNAYGFVSSSAGLIFWWGSYLFIFGAKAFRKARFPLLFLVFAVPLPLVMTEVIISALVSATTFVTRMLFSVFGVPFVQEGYIFYLPGFGLEVAQECSGIRSSLALLITSVLAGQIFLTSPWKKIVLGLTVFPVTVFKNGVRIVTLYLLSYFVDMRIIDGGFLHRSGGFVFFGLGLVILGYFLWLLRKSS